MTAFTRSDLTRTSKAANNDIVPARRYGVLLPAAQVERNLTAFQADILEPVAAALGRGTLSSCYRCPVVNSLVGGSVNSAHTVGLAGDWVPGPVSFSAALHWLVASGLPLERVILEERGRTRWLHLQRHPLDQLPVKTLWFHSPATGVYTSTTAADLARRAP